MHQSCEGRLGSIFYLFLSFLAAWSFFFILDEFANFENCWKWCPWILMCPVIKRSNVCFWCWKSLIKFYLIKSCQFCLQYFEYLEFESKKNKWWALEKSNRKWRFETYSCIYGVMFISFLFVYRLTILF